MTKSELISLFSLSSLGITAIFSAAISVKFYAALTHQGSFSVPVEDHAFYAKTFESSVRHILIWLGFICLANACGLFFGLRDKGRRTVDSAPVFIEAGLFVLGLLSFVAFVWIYFLYYIPDNRWQIPTGDHEFFIQLIGYIYLRVLPLMSIVFMIFAFALWRRLSKKGSSLFKQNAPLFSIKSED